MILLTFKNSDSVIHSTVISVFVSVQSRIHDLVSFCCADKKIRELVKKVGCVERIDFVLYFH